MNNVLDEIKKEALKIPCTKYLTVDYELLIHLGVTERMDVQDAINQPMVRARFLRRDTGDGPPLRLLVYTDSGYLDMGKRMDYFIPKKVPVVARESVPIIPQFDATLDQTTFWIDHGEWKGDQSIPLSKINKPWLDKVHHNLHKKDWDGIADKLFPYNTSTTKIDHRRYLDVLRAYSDKIGQSTYRISMCIHDCVDVLRIFKPVLNWSDVSCNFKWARETLEEFKTLITWERLLSKILIPADLYRKYVSEGLIKPSFK